MKILELHLQSKTSSAADLGGEDRIATTENFAAVIDGVTAKTPSLYPWKNQQAATPGYIAADILATAIDQLDPNASAQEACQYLDRQIFQCYYLYNMLEKVEFNAIERFTAFTALFNKNKNYILLVGDCQALVDGKHYQNSKKVDLLNANARAKEITRLISSKEMTEESLISLPPDQEPGRQLILNPPDLRDFPGLKNQYNYQNSAGPNGYFALDGFANFQAPAFSVINVPLNTKHIVLASDGYIYEGPKSMDTLQQAEQTLQGILQEDPLLYKRHKSVKGKGSNPSFDDRAYIRLKI